MDSLDDGLKLLMPQNTKQTFDCPTTNENVFKECANEKFIFHWKKNTLDGWSWREGDKQHLLLTAVLVEARSAVHGAITTGPKRFRKFDKGDNCRGWVMERGIQRPRWSRQTTGGGTNGQGTWAHVGDATQSVRTQPTGKNFPLTEAYQVQNCNHESKWTA